MADDVVSVIREEYLTCQICQGQYERPKALPCLHSFCAECLQEFLTRRRYDEVGHFPCPCCRCKVDLPSNGAEGFPCNHLLVSLLDTIEAHPSPNAPLVPLPPGEPLIQHEIPPSTQNAGQQFTPRRGDRRRLQTGLALSTPLVPVIHDERNNRLRFGQFGHELTNFTAPIGLAVDDSHIVVSDQHDSRIFVFDWHGRLCSLFRCTGAVQNIDLTPNGQLLVATQSAGRALALKYTLNGQKVAPLGNMFEYEKPSGVASISKDHVLVTSTDTKTIFIMTAEGKLTQKFKSRENPRHVAVSQYGQIAVSDNDHHCIRLYDKLGRHGVRFGVEGSHPGQLKQPLGLCMDRFDNIIVADAGNCRVQVLSSQGRYLDALLDFRGQDSLQMPINVALRNNQQLVVLVVGPDFAEVQVHPYRTPRYCRPGTAPCLCQ